MKLNLERPLVFFDLETTGTNVGKDAIVEISLLKLLPTGEVIKLTERINPGRPIPQEVSNIHGIYDKDVKDKPLFKDLAPSLNEFLKDCDLAGFNSNKFDIPLLVEEFLRVGVDFDLRGRHFVDVQNIFHKMEPRNLKAAYKFYCDKNLENAHSAQADTLATYEILLSQLERYENTEYIDHNGQTSNPIKNNVKSLHDFSFVNRSVDLANHIVFDEKDVEVFNFGKHKGKSVEEVLKIEPNYYDWMMKADFPLYTKKILHAIKLRMLSSKFK